MVNYGIIILCILNFLFRELFICVRLGMLFLLMLICCGLKKIRSYLMEIFKS